MTLFREVVARTTNYFLAAWGHPVAIRGDPERDLRPARMECRCLPAQGAERRCELRSERTSSCITSAATAASQKGRSRPSQNRPRRDHERDDAEGGSTGSHRAQGISRNASIKWCCHESFIIIAVQFEA